jgi:hypothetical protein
MCIGAQQTVRATPPHVGFSRLVSGGVIFGRALGVDRTLGPIRTIRGQEGAKISQPGVAVLGLQSSTARPPEPSGYTARRERNPGALPGVLAQHGR